METSAAYGQMTSLMQNLDNLRNKLIHGFETIRDIPGILESTSSNGRTEVCIIAR